MTKTSTVLMVTSIPSTASWLIRAKAVSILARRIETAYLGKLNSTLDVVAFCARWELDERDLYKALGKLRKKSIVASISS